MDGRLRLALKNDWPKTFAFYLTDDNYAPSKSVYL
jgi:hypothetical protein